MGKFHVITRFNIMQLFYLRWNRDCEAFTAHSDLPFNSHRATPNNNKDVIREYEATLKSLKI